MFSFFLTKNNYYIISAHDVLDPNDPDAAETRNSRAEEPEENTKTLEEYLAEKKNTQSLRRNEARKANEGADDGQWKDAVVLEKEEDVFFVGKVRYSTPSVWFSLI